MNNGQQITVAGEPEEDPDTGAGSVEASLRLQCLQLATAVRSRGETPATAADIVEDAQKLLTFCLTTAESVLQPQVAND